MSDKILFVDDEPNVLHGYQRVLREEFEIDIAVGGKNALTAIERTGPYAIVVTDLRMASMDGIELLTRIKTIAPDTVRMMLTGQADLESAAKAINEGHIFRFLGKPCEKEKLSQALRAGLEQSQLIAEEKNLLEHTLSGTIRLLTEVLSLVNPAAFSRAIRVRRYVDHLIPRLSLRNRWQLEIAAMVSQLGCVALDPEIIEAVYAGRELTPEEQTLYDMHPVMARDLLSSIFRMEPIGWIVAYQNRPAPVEDVSNQNASEMRLSAEILRVTLAFDELLQRGFSRVEAASRLSRQGLNRKILEALIEVEQDSDKKDIRRIRVADLAPGMIIEQEIRTKTGALLATKGQEVTLPLILGLTNLQYAGALAGTVEVSFPKGMAAQAGA